MSSPPRRLPSSRRRALLGAALLGSTSGTPRQLQPWKKQETLRQSYVDQGLTMPRRAMLLSPGTTATHGVYHALCHLGFKSVHWNCHCDHDCTRWSSVFDTERRWDGYNKLLGGCNPGPVEPPYNRFHSSMMDLYFQALSCAANATTGVSSTGWAGIAYNCTADHSAAWEASVQEAMMGLAVSTYLSMTDAPYPSFLTPLMQSYFDDVLVLFSDRDAQEWADARTSDGHLDDPVCAPALWGDDDASLSPLDLVGCLTICREQQGDVRAAPPPFAATATPVPGVPPPRLLPSRRPLSLTTHPPSLPPLCPLPAAQEVGLSDCLVAWRTLSLEQQPDVYARHWHAVNGTFHARLLRFSLFDEATGAAVADERPLRATLRGWFGARSLPVPCPLPTDTLRFAWKISVALVALVAAVGGAVCVDGRRPSGPCRRPLTLCASPRDGVGGGTGGGGVGGGGGGGVVVVSTGCYVLLTVAGGLVGTWLLVTVSEQLLSLDGVAQTDLGRWGGGVAFGCVALLVAFLAAVVPLMLVTGRLRGLSAAAGSAASASAGERAPLAPKAAAAPAQAPPFGDVAAGK